MKKACDATGLTMML